MKKYKKKPIIVTAMLYEGQCSIIKACEFMGVKDNRKDYLEITTLEGIMKVSKGDYIIKGIKGEFYPCKPDIFHHTYDEVLEGK